MVVENVRGAQPWVGRARWSFGSFYLWGDVPALMPAALGRKNDGGFWFAVAHNTTSGHSQNPDGRKLPGFRFDGSGKSFQSAAVAAEGRKGTGSGSGAEWFDANLCKLPSASPRRKQASAMIAKILWSSPAISAARGFRTRKRWRRRGEGGGVLEPSSGASRHPKAAPFAAGVPQSGRRGGVR